MGRPDQANAGEKENAAQQAVHNQAFDLPRSACLHKHNGTVDKAGNAEDSEDDTKDFFCTHVGVYPVDAK